MIQEFETRPFKLMGLCATVPSDKALETAIEYFKKEIGHLFVDIPIATDGKGTEQFARYQLRTILHNQFSKTNVSLKD